MTKSVKFQFPSSHILNSTSVAKHSQKVKTTEKMRKHREKVSERKDKEEIIRLKNELKQERKDTAKLTIYTRPQHQGLCAVGGCQLGCAPCCVLYMMCAAC